jgi:DMSO reductase family type II enzyme heme b subunit
MTENSFDSGSVAKGLAALLIVVVVLAVLILPSTRPRNPESPLATDEKGKKTGTPATTDEFPPPKSGRELYVQHCAACHGDNGDGRGIAAAYLFPKPRDLRAGRFRLVSTANNVPTPEDLAAVLVRGMPGSSMPSWAHLSERDRAALVEEVMRLRADGARATYVTTLKEEEELTDEEIAEPDVQEEIAAFVKRFTTPGESSEVPEFGEPDGDTLARGKEQYVKQSCHSCHGKEGKGDGVQKQFDAEGFPTQPRDYTRGIFKGGHDPASLYRRIAYGMPGTPMPGAAKATPQERVDLVHFIRSMSNEETRNAAVLKRRQLVAKRVDQIPGGDSEGWASLSAVGIQAVPLWWRDDADHELQVQAAHDGETLAIRLSWRDESENRHATQTQSFEDAVAVELYRGDAEPFVGMGGPKSPVDVWFWDADRQTQSVVENTYPNTVVDIYPFSEKLVDTASFNRPGTKTADQPDISLPARASGNPIVPKGAESGASSLTGAGPGTATFRIPQSRLVTAQGQYIDNRWDVVMTRSLSVESESEGVSLEPGTRASIAFAIWDGSQRDRDGKKLVTIWNDLDLE